MSSFEDKLAEYRAKKKLNRSRKELEQKIWDILTLKFVRKWLSAVSPRWNEVAQDIRRNDSDDENEGEDGGAQPLTKLDLVIYLVQVLIWLCLFGLMVKLEFGLVFLILSGFFLIWKTLGRRKKGQLSAYSVFNPNFETIDGTLTAEQFDKEIRHKTL